MSYIALRAVSTFLGGGHTRRKTLVFVAGFHWYASDQWGGRMRLPRPGQRPVAPSTTVFTNCDLWGESEDFLTGPVSVFTVTLPRFSVLVSTVIPLY